jgi:dephospho-CoA kinase
MARSSLTKEEAYARIAAQFPQDQKIQGADFVIWNDGDLRHLREQTEAVIKSQRTPVVSSPRR